MSNEVTTEARANAITVRQTTSIDVRPQYRAPVALLPFQFSSVSHFVKTADAIITEDAATKGLSDRTLKWWRECLHVFARFLRETHADFLFLRGDVQQQVVAIDQWVKWLRTERRVSHITVRTYWTALDAVCRRIERARGFVNPFSLLVTPKAGPPDPRLLVREDAERLLDVIAHYQWPSAFLCERNLAIVGLMLLAGLRRGEVLRLRTADINIESNTIRIRRGKGKFGGRPRKAYMAPQLREILSRYSDVRREAGRADPHLVTLSRTDAPASVTTIKRLFERLSKLTGFRVSPHMLRHTYATLLRQAGVADRVSMELLGHRSLTMLKRYSHVFEGEFETEAQRLRLNVAL